MSIGPARRVTQLAAAGGFARGPRRSQGRVACRASQRTRASAAAGNEGTPCNMTLRKRAEHAKGGVRSELSSSNEAAARAPLGQGDEPIRVESL